MSKLTVLLLGKRKVRWELEMVDQLTIVRIERERERGSPTRKLQYIANATPFQSQVAAITEAQSISRLDRMTIMNGKVEGESLYATVSIYVLILILSRVATIYIIIYVDRL